jgi:hypothetical protein
LGCQIPTTPDPASVSSSYNVQDINGSSGQVLNCSDYANFLNSGQASGEDQDKAILNYFHLDPSTVTDSQIDSIITAINNCVTSLRATYQEAVDDHESTSAANVYWNTAATLDPAGTSPLKTIEETNDANVQETKDNQQNNDLIADLPNCDDPRTISGLKAYLAQSPDPQLNSISIIEMKNIQDISSPAFMGYRVCEADALLNAGEFQITYQYHWFDKTSNHLAYSFHT